MIEEKTVMCNIEKLFQRKIWTERFALLISIGLFFLIGPGFFGIMVSVFDTILRILLSLLAIILALIGLNFGLTSLIDSIHGFLSYVSGLSFPIYQFYGNYGLGVFLVFLISIGVVGWVISSIRYRQSKQEVLKSSEMEEAAVGSLIEYVQNKSYGEYGAIISILGDIANKRATIPIIQALTDGNEEIKQKSIKALGNIGDERAIESLTQALEDQNESIRSAAKDALEKIEKKLKIEEQKSGDIK